MIHLEILQRMGYTAGCTWEVDQAAAGSRTRAAGCKVGVPSFPWAAAAVGR